MIQTVFHVKYLNDLVAFVEAGFDVASTIRGLQDVNLAIETGGVAGTYRVTAKTKVGLNLAELYPTVLNTASNWLVQNFTSGNAITVTGVTIGKNASGEDCFVFVLDTADLDYPSAGQKLTVDLQTPAALQAVGVDGYESTGRAEMVRN